MSAWYEMVIEGKEEDVRDLLPGVAAEGERTYRGDELDLHAGSFPERILELLGARTHQLLLVPGTQAGPFARAIQGKPEIHLEQVREITRGRFPFEAKAYSPDVAAKIKETLHAPLPPGVVLEDLVEGEDVDPSAEGVELYSAAHDYVYRCHGAFSGPPPGIFEVHRVLQALDFVHQEKLELEGREVAATELV